MENRQIPELHEKAVEYDAIKTRRMKLTEEESRLKQEILALMEQYGKEETGYNMDGIEIEYIPGKTTDPKVKVKIRPVDEELADGEVGDAA